MHSFFIDTNIFLDLILKREPFYQNCLLFFDRSVQRHCPLYTSAISIGDINYLLSRNIKSRKGVVLILQKLLQGTEIITTTKAVFEEALKSHCKDLEDAFQYFTALTRPDISAFITNNKKDYKSLSIYPLPVLNIAEALKYYLND